MHVDSTQIAGMLGLGLAALAAAAAFVAERHDRLAKNTWAGIAALHAILASEVLVMLRHRVEGGVGDWLRTAGGYSERRPGQSVLILVIIGVAIFVARHVVRRAADRRLAVALGSTMTLVTLFVVESISLHQIDSVLYRPVGPLLTVGWLWIACALVTIMVAVRAVGRRRF